jgi:photosystem II stability/assembly factor-like uncharacterized protein
LKVIFTVLCLGIFACAQWQPVAVPQWDGPLTAIAQLPDANWIVAANGTGVYRSTDGATWHFMGAPTQLAIESLLVWNQALYAGTHNGLFVSNDEGATWSRTGTLRASTTVFAMAASISKLYLATDVGIYVHPVNTSVWSKLPNFALESRAILLASTPSGTSLLVGATCGCNGGGLGNGDVYITNDDGSTWKRAGLPVWSIRALAQAPDGTIYAGAYYKNYAAGGLYTSTDSALSWSAGVLPNLSVQAITFSPASVTFGTREGQLFTLISGAPTLAANPSGKAVLALNYPFLGSDGIYRLDDASHPVLSSIPEIEHIWSCSGITYYRSSFFGVYSSSEGYIDPTGSEDMNVSKVDPLDFCNALGQAVVVEQTAVYVRQGSSWRKATFSPTPIKRLSGWTMDAGGTIYLGDFGGDIFRSLDGGATFSKLGKNGAGIVFDLAYNAGIIYAATETKSVMQSSDGGKTWSGVGSAFGKGNDYSVFVSPSGTLLSGRANPSSLGSLFRLTPNGWIRSDRGVPAGESIYSLMANHGTVFAMGGSGIYESADDGNTWSRPSGLIPFVNTYQAQIRPTSPTILPDGSLIVGVHGQGAGAFSRR